MRIGIIGSGNVGGALGKQWSKNGHSVFFASRDAQSEAMQRLLGECGSSSKSGSITEAVRESEVVLLATPWPVTQQLLESAGDFQNKILIDATNPLAPGLTGLEVGTTMSAGELVAGWATNARVVKAFNTVGANIMANPKFHGASVALFYCGDDAGAKKIVAGLIAELGFDALDAGPLAQARLLEPFALLWISLALKYGFGPDIAFQFLRR